MADEPAEHRGKRLGSVRRALLLVEEAIDILDHAEAPEEIAAYLDMGRHRLEGYLCRDE